jgi:Protein of unknown function (DUF3551)
MRRVPARAAVLGVMALSANGAAAAAYCAYAGGVAGFENCGYHTLEQCRAGAAGHGRACMRNPHDPAAWGVRAAPQPSPRHHGRTAEFDQRRSGKRARHRN